MNLPEHVAIIMDGNGRWAQARGRDRAYGHLRGARAAKKIITASTEIGLKNLTLFTFSTENWQRPTSEVDFLMRLLDIQIRRERKTLMDNNIRFFAIGDLERIPKPARQVVEETIVATQENTGMKLTFALNYGGRQEITGAMKKIAKQVVCGELRPDEIDESTIAANLESRFLPNPDLIIRTSGEQRLSNFFLWQAAYSEILIVKKHWPDFGEADLKDALGFFGDRARRYGQIQATSDAQQST